MIMVQGMRLAIPRLVVGLVGALQLTRTLASLLFGVTASDPPTFVAVAALMMAVMLAACFIPAPRAMRVNPMRALRCE